MSVCLKMCSQTKSLKAFFIAVGGLNVLLHDRFTCYKMILVSITGRGVGGSWERKKINVLGISQQEIFVLGADIIFLRGKSNHIDQSA